MAITTRLDGCIEAVNQFRDGLLKEDPTVLAARIEKLVESVEKSPFKLAQNRERITELKKGLLVLATKPRAKATDTPSDSLIDTPKKDAAKYQSTETSSSSLLGTVGGGLIAIPKFVLWTVPSSLLSGAFGLVSGSSSSSEKQKKPVDVVDSRIGVSGESTVNAHQAERIPVGLMNENGDDCFLNSVRQFVYNTPIARYVLPNLDRESFRNTHRDFANYQAQKVGVPMGGSISVRDELMPVAQRHGHQDAHEALMKLFIFIEGARFKEKASVAPENMLKGTQNPLFNWVENTRTYDLASLPKGLSYDQFTQSSKSDFNIGNSSSPSYADNVSHDLVGPLSLSIKPGGGPVIQTLQGVWDNFANPELVREVPSSSEDEYGAFLDKSTRLTEEMLKSGRVVANRRGQYKALPDKVGERFRFTDAPKHLVFSLKRFAFRRGFGDSKIQDPIEVGETFRLDHKHIKGGKAADYRIKAFALHNGGTGGGHYLSYILKGEQWYECNDSAVRPISKEEAKRVMRHAYNFYAERIGSASEYRGSVSIPRSRERVRPSLVRQKLPHRQSYLTTKPMVGTTIPRVSFKGKTIVGEVNQNDVVGGKNSCAAQALGFLAKTLNGSPVSRESLKPLLEENQAKFRDLLDAQAKKTQKASLASENEWGHQGVIDLIVDEVEGLIEDYNTFMKAGAQSSDLAGLLSSVNEHIIEKYKTFYRGQGKSALESNLSNLIAKRLKNELSKTRLANQVAALVRTDGAVDRERIETAKRLHGSAFSGETRNVFSVYPAFKDSFGNKEFPVAQTVHLDANTEMRTATFRSVLSQLKDNYLTGTKQKAVGSVLSCNGYTYSVALTQQEDRVVQYQIFDSHGNKALTGSDNAFIFKTNDEVEAAQFLTQLIEYRPPSKRLAQLEDQNELGWYTVVPAPEKIASTSYMHPVLNELYKAGSYTVSGIYTVASFPFKGLYSLASYATQSCSRSKPTPVQKVSVETVPEMSSQALGTELAKFRSEIRAFQNTEKAFTENDLTRLGDALFRLQPVLKAHPALETVSEQLSLDIAELHGRIPVSSKPVTQSSSLKDPKNLIPFYRGEKPNVHGYTLEQILAFDDTEMERHHNFIQWLFPTKRLGADPQAALLDPPMIQAIKTDSRVQANLLRSFDKMLGYYGLERKASAVVKASNFAARKKYWTINGAHNLLRMTRMITSMGMLGCKTEAKNFGECIIDIAKRGDVTGLGKSPRFWADAVRDHT